MKPRRLRILSYNIHKGFSLLNRNLVLKQIREAIRSVQADLVFLQEVIGEHSEHPKNHEDWPTESQFEYLADEVWPHYAYGKNAVYKEGHHGNAILSKFPFKSWENIDISTHRFAQRGLLHGVLEIPGFKKPLHAICIHMGLFETERKMQAFSLADRISHLIPKEEPLIIAGDFNDWREHVHELLQETCQLVEVFQELHGSHARTYPSWMPALKMDRIYHRGFRSESGVCLSGKPWNQLSDHVSLYAELEFPL